MGKRRALFAGIVERVSFSPDGNKLAVLEETDGGNAVVHVWDITENREAFNFEVQSECDSSKTITFSPNSTILYATGDELSVVDVATGKCTKQDNPISSIPGLQEMTVCPTCDKIGGIDENNVIYIMNLDSERVIQEVRVLPPPDRQTGSALGFEGHHLSLSPTGRLLAVEGVDTVRRVAENDESLVVTQSQVRLSDFNSPESVKVFPKATKPLFTANGKILGFIEEGRRIALFDLNKASLAGQFDCPAGVDCFSISHDSKTLAVICQDGRLLLWDITSGKEIRRQKESLSQVRCLEFSPHGNILCVAGEALLLLQTVTGAEIHPVDGHLGPVVGLAFSQDGSSLASLGMDDMVHLWRVNTGTTLREFSSRGISEAGYREPIGRLDFLEDGKRLVVAGTHGIKAWVCADSRWKKEKEIKDVERNYISISPDYDWSARLGSESVHINRIGTNMEPQKVEYNGGFPLNAADAVAFAKNGRAMALVTHARSENIEDCYRLTLWDFRKAKKIDEVLFFDKPSICSLAHPSFFQLLFSPDGQHVAFRAESKIHIWNLARRKYHRLIQTADKGVLSKMAFSPDSRTIACGSMTDGTVLLWDVITGTQRYQFTGHREPVSCVQFSPDLKEIATGCVDSSICVWDLAKMVSESLPEFTEMQFEVLWNQLGSGDSQLSYAAVWTLVAASSKALPFLDKKVRAIFTADFEQVEKLIDDLDNADFGIRERATNELRQMKGVAIAFLEERLKQKVSPEAGRRIVLLLQDLASYTSNELRAIRAVEVLEIIANHQAKLILSDLAKGQMRSPLTSESQAALDRLFNRFAKVP
jgi:WD40 repeat protein